MEEYVPESEYDDAIICNHAIVPDIRSTEYVEVFEWIDLSSSWYDDELESDI
jgi:hypothetical protein